jgi:hypothetical protein
VTADVAASVGEPGMGFGRTMPAVRLAASPGDGYTVGMKTAISVPDDLFRKAERIARETRKSRSQIFSEALRDYVARHDPDEITMALDRVVEAEGASETAFSSSAAGQALERSEW